VHLDQSPWTRILVSETVFLSFETIFILTTGYHREQSAGLEGGDSRRCWVPLLVGDICPSSLLSFAERLMLKQPDTELQQPISSCEGCGVRLTGRIYTSLRG
jgi:hypothetical protein